MNSDKLIKQGIKYTDSVFKEIENRVNQGVRQCDTLEEFLAKYKEYTDGKGENNPLVLNGYKDEMLKIILSETNNHKFSRPSQKELVRVTIENYVGDLITDVGEDVRDSVREVVKDGYDNNLSQDEIAENITSKVDGIKNRRARAIARTEIARTATTSDYIINKERGATHFYVECRNTACPVCKKAWHSKWTPENDSSFNPRDESAGGKGWIGDKVFSMNSTGDLPPKHPNCRCVAYFITEKDIDKDMVVINENKPTTTTTIEESVQGHTNPNDKKALALALSNEELNAMDFQELSRYFGLEYRGIHNDIVDKHKKHLFVEVFDDDRRMGIYFDEDAITSYTKKGIATPNEIIAEVMKVPLENRKETNHIYFHDDYRGILQSGEPIDANTLGYNRTRIMGTDYDHGILINPRFFKGSKGPGASKWLPDDEGIIRWKKNIHHEFEHSGDQTKELFDSDEYMPLCWSEEYSEVHFKEKYFTEYANSERNESWAEHGGYISYMEANPSEQHRLITIQVWDDENELIERKINYSQYKKEYPEHYNFFMKKHKGEMEFNVLK